MFRSVLHRRHTETPAHANGFIRRIPSKYSQLRHSIHPQCVSEEDQFPVVYGPSFSANYHYYYFARIWGLGLTYFGQVGRSVSALQALIAMAPQPLILHDTYHSNSSAYTLATVHTDDMLSPVHTPASPLLTPNSASYGATFPRSPGVAPNSRKLLFNAALKMCTIFVVSTLLLGGTLWIALPTLEE
jgi:hypothetical protein